VNQIETLAAEVAELYAAMDTALEDAGRRGTEALRLTDPPLLRELIRTFGSEDGAAAWLVSQTARFGGRSALDLLALGEREQVMHVLHHLQYGFCT
jgi:Protein of unknown function (DUF2384)